MQSPLPKTCRTPGCVGAVFVSRAGFVYDRCAEHIPARLTLGNVSIPIEPTNLPDGTGRFLYFNFNNIPQMVTEGARLIAERIASLGLKSPFFVTPETGTIALAHVLRTAHGIDGILLSKSKRPDEADNVYHQDYCAITSRDKKTLYMHKRVDLSERDLILIDTVATTGETMRAMYHLLEQAGVAGRVREVLVLWTEGEPITSFQVSGKTLPLFSFAHIPLLALDPSVDNRLWLHYSETNLPTEYGLVQFHVFRHRSLSDKEAIAILSPLTFSDPTRAPDAPVMVRVHDACFTSETFHSHKCDCRQQLVKALDYIREYGGMIVYLQQEGRGIGLGNKIAAYGLQETQGLDTVDANRRLGLPDDTREYTAVRDILDHFGVKSVLLMTNNPRKVLCLTELGIRVAGRLPCLVREGPPQMVKYVKDKAQKMGHTVPVLPESPLAPRSASSGPL